MGFDIALVVLTYNSDLLKTIATLESARMQRGVRFKVIVADDGSSNNNIDHIERYLSGAGFDAYEVLDRKKNVGTVRNLREALDYADAPFVKPISPGDYLYGRGSLNTISSIMSEGDLAFCFGRAVYYQDIDGMPQILNQRRNILTTLCAGQNTDISTLKKYQIRHGYSAHGASAAYCTKHLSECLDVLSANSIRLCEDLSTRLMVMKSLPFTFIDDYLIWYEYGTGVSKNHASKSYQMVQSDGRVMVTLLSRMYPLDPDVRATGKRTRGPQGKDLISKLRRAARDPEHAILSLKARALRRVEKLPQVDTGDYCEIMDAARERLAHLDEANSEG